MRLWILVFGLFPTVAPAAEISVKAVESAKPVLVDPNDPGWAAAPASTVPLMPQALVNPRGGGSVASVRVQALIAGQTLHLRLEWEDAAKDEDNSAAEGFADACAVELPARPDSWPSPFMGDAEAPVVLWRWSAAAQKDVEGGWQENTAVRPRLHSDGGKHFGQGDPLYLAALGAGNPLAQRDRISPVDYLGAKGFGTLTMFPDQPVQGMGGWSRGRWSVVLSRRFEGDPTFRKAQSLPIAFAVWNGGKGERNGAKNVSVWHTLEIGAVPAGKPPTAAAQGERIFRRYGCAACHGSGGKGGVANPNAQGGQVPPIARVKEGFTAEELKRVIRKGRRSVPEDARGPVPPLHMNEWEKVMDEGELDALAEYLFSLMPKEEPGKEW